MNPEYHPTKHECWRHKIPLVFVTETVLQCAKCNWENFNRIQNYNLRLQRQIAEERRLRSQAQKVIGKLLTINHLNNFHLDFVIGELKKGVDKIKEKKDES